MKICIIGPAHPLRGGIAAFNERLCATLQEQGHECQIISYTLQYPGILFPGKTQYDDGPAPDDILILPMINSINPISWFRTAFFIAKAKPDLIIYRFWIPFMGPALGTIIRILKKNKFNTLAIVDNLIPHEKRPGDSMLTRYFLKHVSKFLVMSDEVRRDVLAMKPNAKVILQRHPIYNQYGHSIPVQEARSFLGLPSDESIILFFGLVRKYKGLDLLLEAFAESKCKENAVIVVAGEFYDKKSDYDEMVDKLGIKDRVKWFDSYIPNESVKYFFSACNLLALPYRTATQSGVTQVAFHFETPVLVTDVGGLGEIIHHDVNGLVVDANVHSISKNLDFFFENQKELSYRHGMKIEKAKYDWFVFTRNLLDFSEA